MADHSVLSQLVQIGKEAGRGAGGVANRKLPNINITLAPQMDFTEWRGAGHKFVDSVVPGDEWAQGTSSGPITYGEIIFPLSSIVSFSQSGVTSVGPFVASVNAKKWVFACNPYGDDTVATFVVQRGDSLSQFKWSYVYWNELTIKANRKEGSFSGTVKAQTMTVASAGSLDAGTDVENVILVPQKFDIYSATAMHLLNGGLATPYDTRVKLLRAFDWEFKLGNRFSEFFPMNSAKTSFDGMVETAVDATLSLRVGMDTTLTDFSGGGPTLNSHLRTGDRIYIRLEALGPVIDATPAGAIPLDTGAVTAAGTGYNPGIHTNIRIIGSTTGTGARGFAVVSANGTVTAFKVYEGGYNYSGTITGVLPATMGGGTGFTFSVGTPAASPTDARYMFRVDAAAVVNQPIKWEDQNGLALNGWDMRIVTDADSGMAFEITVVNKTAAL